MTTSQLHWWHRASMAVSGSALGSWIGARLAPPLDRLVVRLTGGRHSFTSFCTGLPLIWLTTLGAKSGQPRTVPLIGMPVGRELMIIASNWGQAHYPAWYHNLRANPAVSVRSGGSTGRYLAREVSGDERERCWALAVARYPGYAGYKQRATQRTIPVVLLAPEVHQGER
ncbi:MAG: nitroreductase family deazaflavin-dependent oxidoreductase [Chloroflexaceae bacterium]|nr:nitroreductase family deazaflavin-dependent oxidoreductase [Chloroflexaceae bacterium]